jgi:hypothetical protein
VLKRFEKNQLNCDIRVEIKVVSVTYCLLLICNFF